MCPIEPPAPRTLMYGYRPRRCRSFKIERCPTDPVRLGSIPLEITLSKSLLDQIESEALNGDVVKALRLCITLGGKSSSAEIREWASLELRGYGPEDDLPSYRRIVAPLSIDRQTAAWAMTGEEISHWDLPEFAREDMTNEVNLPHSITELRDMVKSVERKGGPIRLGPPGAAEIVKYMNLSEEYSGYIKRLYWKVSAVTVNGVVERVCTDIIGLVSEMRAGMNRDEKVPSPDVASQAFNMVINGEGNRITVKNTQTSGSNPSTKSLTRKTLETLAWLAAIIATSVLLWQNFV